MVPWNNNCKLCVTLLSHNIEVHKHTKMTVGLNKRERHTVTNERLDRSVYQQTEEQTESVQSYFVLFATTMQHHALSVENIDTVCDPLHGPQSGMFVDNKGEN